MPDEAQGITIGEGAVAETERRGKHCLVGRIMADRAIARDVIRTKMLRIWTLFGSVSFKEIDVNLFLLEFTHEGDKAKISNGMPWLSDNHLFAIMEFDGITPPISWSLEM